MSIFSPRKLRIFSYIRIIFTATWVFYGPVCQFNIRWNDIRDFFISSEHIYLSMRWPLVILCIDINFTFALVTFAPFTCSCPCLGPGGKDGSRRPDPGTPPGWSGPECARPGLRNHCAVRRLARRIRGFRAGVARVQCKREPEGRQRQPAPARGRPGGSPEGGATANRGNREPPTTQQPAFHRPPARVAPQEDGNGSIPAQYLAARECVL